MRAVGKASLSTPGRTAHTSVGSATMNGGIMPIRIRKSSRGEPRKPESKPARYGRPQTMTDDFAAILQREWIKQAQDVGDPEGYGKGRK